MLLALEALEHYPYTWQAERALGQAVLGSRVRLSFEHKATVNTAVWSSDGTRILTASEDGTAKVWDATQARNAWCWQVIKGRYDLRLGHLLANGYSLAVQMAP